MLTRRTALLGSLGGLGLVAATASACDVDDLRPSDSDAPVAPSATSPGGPTADEALVTDAATAVQTAAATVAAARKVPPLRSPLSSLLRDHRRHLAALDAEEGAAVVPVPSDATVALAAVSTAERTLHEQLAGFAVRAESGTLAALLASMSASVAQHLAALESAPESAPESAG